MINLLFTGIEAIFLRLHNQLAKDLHSEHPKWSSDRIYEESRKINIAFFQRLIYEHWLPLLLGKETFEAELSGGPITKYNENVKDSRQI